MSSTGTSSAVRNDSSEQRIQSQDGTVPRVGRLFAVAVQKVFPADDGGGVRAFICPTCSHVAQSRVIGKFVQNLLCEPTAEFALLKCSSPECQAPVVQVREDFGGGFEADTPGVYFPTPRRLNPAIPEELRDEFSEARTCFEAKAHRASVMMARHALERTCHMNGATKGTLQAKLETLEKQGTISGDLTEWADLLRLTGNAGSHDDDDVSPEDAKDMLDFTEALLNHLYVLRARFDEFKARRQQKTAPNSV